MPSTKRKVRAEWIVPAPAQKRPCFARNGVEATGSEGWAAVTAVTPSGYAVLGGPGAKVAFQVETIAVPVGRSMTIQSVQNSHARRRLFAAQAGNAPKHCGVQAAAAVHRMCVSKREGPANDDEPKQLGQGCRIDLPPECLARWETHNRLGSQEYRECDHHSRSSWRYAVPALLAWLLFFSGNPFLPEYLSGPRQHIVRISLALLPSMPSNPSLSMPGAQPQASARRSGLQSLLERRGPSKEDRVAEAGALLRAAVKTSTNGVVSWVQRSEPLIANSKEWLLTLQQHVAKETAEALGALRVRLSTYDAQCHQLTLSHPL